MRSRLRTLALGPVVLALALAPGRAGAQDPYAEYNRQRAYRQFLTSPSPYRTYSGTTPGYSYDTYTPYGYGHFWRGPGYLHQRITPRGFESYRAEPPGRGYLVTPGAWVAPAPAYRVPPDLGSPSPLLPPGPAPNTTPPDPAAKASPEAPAPLPPPEEAPAPGGPTYPYDGGPDDPLPAPKDDEAQAGAVRLPAPARGRSASLPGAGGRWVYPAYGEAPRRDPPGEGRVLRAAGRRPAKRTAP